MSDVIIREGFEKKLKTWAEAQTPVVPVSWQNVKFTPPTGRYVEARLLHGPTRDLFLDGSGREYNGIFQVTFHMPVDTGPFTVEDLHASLAAVFGTSFTEGSLRVNCTPLRLHQAVPDADRYIVPTSLTYSAVIA